MCNNICKDLHDRFCIYFIAIWVESVTNHFWRSLTTSTSSADFVERFQSMVHHVINKHHWPGCHTFKKCVHPNLSDSRTKWLNPASIAYIEFRKIIMHITVKTDLLQIEDGVHITLLEVTKAYITYFYDRIISAY